jgi:hypothetical protein
MVTVATFETEADAEPVKDRLERAGVHAEVQHESKLQTFWMSHEHASVKVRVPNDDLDEATTLLKKWDSQDAVLSHAIKCPECGSSRVQYPQYTRKFILPGLVGFALAGFKNKFYCQSCHNIWPLGTYSFFGEM